MVWEHIWTRMPSNMLLLAAWEKKNAEGRERDEVGKERKEEGRERHEGGRERDEEEGGRDEIGREDEEISHTRHNRTIAITNHMQGWDRKGWCPADLQTFSTTMTFDQLNPYQFRVVLRLQPTSFKKVNPRRRFIFRRYFLSLSMWLTKVTRYTCFAWSWMHLE